MSLPPYTLKISSPCLQTSCQIASFFPANIYFLEARLLPSLHPLTGGLGLLILAVEVLVDFLLLTATALLDRMILTGLAIGLGGLKL